MTHNPYLIHPATIVQRKQESTEIVTTHLQGTAPADEKTDRFWADHVMRSIIV